MSQLTPQKTKTCHQVKVLRFLLRSQLLNGIVCLTEDSQSWVCVRAGTGGAELPLDNFYNRGRSPRVFWDVLRAPIVESRQRWKSFGARHATSGRLPWRSIKKLPYLKKPWAFICLNEYRDFSYFALYFWFILNHVTDIFDTGYKIAVTRSIELSIA